MVMTYGDFQINIPIKGNENLSIFDNKASPIFNSLVLSVFSEFMQ